MPVVSPARHYDAIVVGARAAGGATGLLLARAGLDVLVVERARYGDDTLSTHALMRAGVLQLHRWGLLERIIAAGTPPVRRTTFHLGDEQTVVTIKPSHGIDALYAPRRTVLDPILADAAVEAGAEIRYATTVTGLQRDDTGRVLGVVGRDRSDRPFAATATITIGADGANSRLAQWVGAPLQRAGTSAGAAVYGYWGGLASDGYEWVFRPGEAAGIIPTNDDEACVFVGMTTGRFRREFTRDPMRAYLERLRTSAPQAAERLANARPPSRLHRFPGRPGHLRRPRGPGWALVGDAGYFKDPITAHGLTDALRDAELLARAVIAIRGGADEARTLGAYEATRNRLSERMLTVTETIAGLRWNAAEIGPLLLEVSSSMNDEVAELASLDDDMALAR